MTARAALLSLLSRLLLREVDPDLLLHLAREEIAEGLETLAPGARAEILRARQDELAREALDAEYCRLFVLPTGLPPFAAAWRSGDAAATRVELQSRIGQVLAALEVRLDAHGLGNPPPDHIGVLLALAAVAEEREPGGRVAGDAIDLLRPWGETFAERLAAGSEAALYRASGRLLAEVLGPRE